MSEYLPPNNIEPISIFNPANFETITDYLTIDYANKHYLKYPNAQGTENLQAINVNGVSTFNNTSTFNSSSVHNSGSFFNNVVVFADPSSGHQLNCRYSGNDLIFRNLAPYANNGLTYFSFYSDGAGNVINSLITSRNGVSINPKLSYPDTTEQTSAFTGAGALAGSYTNTSMTIDTNGKITALSSGSAGTVSSTYYTIGTTITIPSGCYKIDAVIMGKGGFAGETVVNDGGAVWLGSAGGGGGMCSISSIPCQAGNTFTTTLGSNTVIFKNGALQTIAIVNNGLNGAIGSSTPPSGGNGGNTATVLTSFSPTANFNGLVGGSGINWTSSEGALPSAGTTFIIGNYNYTKGQSNQAFNGFASFGYVDYPADTVGVGGVIITFYYL